MVVAAIPQWFSEPIQTRQCRWKATSGFSNAAYSGREIAQAVVGMFATAATTSYHLARALRIKCIDIYFVATALGTITEVVVDWAVSTGVLVYTPNSSIERATTSTAEMQHLRAVPPVGSLSSMWQEADSTTDLVTLTLPVSAILDFTVEYVLNDSDAAMLTTNPSGATAGTIYHRQLDANLAVMGNPNTIA